MKNGIVRNRKYKKGVALIFSMFVAALLAAMSTTVVAVSINGTKDSAAVSYNDAALQAANWGIDAAINFMGQPGYKYDPSKGGNNSYYTQWEVSGTSPLVGTRLKKIDSSKQALGLNASVRVVVNNDLDKDYINSNYGVNVDGYKRDGSWVKGDTCLIKFYPITGGTKEEYKIDYYNDTYATVEILCTENRFYTQPSNYQLLAVSKVYNGRKSDKKDSSLLATRMVESNVREANVSDFMHFVQNARSWDANGVDISRNNQTQGGHSARTAVLLPEGYNEQGRLRVDGYGTPKNADPENNAVKKYLHEIGVDGKIGFFSESGSFDPKKYNFNGAVYTEKSGSNFNFRSRGNHTDRSGDKLTGSFGTLYDNAGSLGLPQSGRDFYDNNEDGIYKVLSSNKTPGTNKASFSIGTYGYNKTNTGTTVGSSISAVKGYYNSHTNECPDIAQGTTTGYDNKGNKRNDMPASVPTFATVRVEVKGDECRILKYNTAVSNGDTGKNVENITPNSVGGVKADGIIKIDKIKGGVVCVQGGNVEVVNVTSFGAKGNGGFAFGNTDTKIGTLKPSDNTYKTSALDGQLTIVSDINEGREEARINGNSSKRGNIYSTKAREMFEKYQEDTTNTSLAPPYSASQLKTGSSTIKNIWPSPSTSSVEREGNVIIGSDIVTKEGTDATFGIVANNFIYLTDRAAAKTGKSTQCNSNTYVNGKTDKNKASRTLTVDGVLYSMDHSVQFDWNNLAGLYDNRINENVMTPFKKLSNPIGKDLGKKADQYARIFKLNGAIVGGFLDVEGDTYGRGYYTQNFTHNNKLRYNLPPYFPKWNLSETAENGMVMPFVVLSYKDRGAINDY